MHAVSPAVDREVGRLKLAALGVEIDEPTDEQTEYLSSWSAVGPSAVVTAARLARELGTDGVGRRERSRRGYPTAWPGSMRRSGEDFGPQGLNVPATLRRGAHARRPDGAWRTLRGMSDVASDKRGGIDLGGTKIEAIVVDADNQVLGQARRPTPTEGGPADVAKQMAEAMTEAAAAAKLETSALTGVGVGSPGSVDEAAGTVTQARNLPGWNGTFELAKTLGDALGTPVKIGNDVQVAITRRARARCRQAV